MRPSSRMRSTTRAAVRTKTSAMPSSAGVAQRSHPSPGRTAGPTGRPEDGDDDQHHAGPVDLRGRAGGAVGPRGRRAQDGEDGGLQTEQHGQVRRARPTGRTARRWPWPRSRRRPPSRRPSRSSWSPTGAATRWRRCRAPRRRRPSPRRSRRRPARGVRKSSGAAVASASGVRSTSVTTSRATVTIAPSTSSAVQRVRVTCRASIAQVTRGVQAPTNTITSSTSKPSNAGPGRLPASNWATAKSSAPTASGRQGRAAAGSMRRSPRTIDQVEVAAIAARTSSSHCMPVPSGALNGTVTGRPSRPSAGRSGGPGGGCARSAVTCRTARPAHVRHRPSGQRLLGLERAGEDVALQVAVAHVAQRGRAGRRW